MGVKIKQKSLGGGEYSGKRRADGNAQDNSSTTSDSDPTIKKMTNVVEIFCHRKRERKRRTQENVQRDSSTTEASSSKMEPPKKRIKRTIRKLSRKRNAKGNVRKDSQENVQHDWSPTEASSSKMEPPTKKMKRTDIKFSRKRSAKENVRKHSLTTSKRKATTQNTTCHKCRKRSGIKWWQAALGGLRKIINEAKDISGTNPLPASADSSCSKNERQNGNVRNVSTSKTEPTKKKRKRTSSEGRECLKKQRAKGYEEDLNTVDGSTSERKIITQKTKGTRCAGGKNTGKKRAEKASIATKNDTKLYIQQEAGKNQNACDDSFTDISNAEIETTRKKKKRRRLEDKKQKTAGKLQKCSCAADVSTSTSQLAEFVATRKKAKRKRYFGGGKRAKDMKQKTAGKLQKGSCAANVSTSAKQLAEFVAPRKKAKRKRYFGGGMRARRRRGRLAALARWNTIAKHKNVASSTPCDYDPLALAESSCKTIKKHTPLKGKGKGPIQRDRCFMEMGEINQLLRYSVCAVCESSNLSLRYSDKWGSCNEIILQCDSCQFKKFFSPSTQ